MTATAAGAKLDRRRDVRSYALILAVAVLSSVPLALAWRNLYAEQFLKRAGELQPIEVVTVRQQQAQALYGSAVFEDDVDYKLELIRARKPAVVALGSSRALQFREEFFNTSFVNAGRAMNAIPHGASFVDAMLAEHRPELVILALDVWWLNPNRREPPTSGRDLEQTRRPVSLFWGYVNEGKISGAKTLRVMLGDRHNPISGRPSIGIAALARGNGFRPDGSRDYGARYFGTDPTFDDRNFANTRHRVRNNGSLLNYGQDISDERLLQLGAAIARLQAAGVEIVAVIPPFAPSIQRMIDARPQQYAYLPKARAAYRSLPTKVYDFMDAQYNADCEFADGLHAGDVNYQRMLLSIVDADPAGALAARVRRDILIANIRDFAGHSVTPTAADGYRYREADFLGIGCQKN